MRDLILGFTAALLAACATNPAGPVAPVSPPAAAPRPTEPIADAHHEALREDVMMAVNTGDYARCERAAEPLVFCGDERDLEIAYLCACGAHSFATAEELFHRIAARKPALRQICMREGFDPESRP